MIFESTCAPTIDNSIIPNLDKIIHFFVFGCIAWLLAVVMDNKGWFADAYIRIASMSMVCVGLFSVGDEYLQSFTLTRHAEFVGVLADMAGALVVLVVWGFYKQGKNVMCKSNEPDTFDLN